MNIRGAGTWILLNYWTESPSWLMTVPMPFPNSKSRFFQTFQAFLETKLGQSCNLNHSPAEAALPSSGNSWGWCHAPRSWRTCRRAEWLQRSGYGSTPGPPPPQRIPHQRAKLTRAAEGRRQVNVLCIHTHTHKAAKTQSTQTTSVTYQRLVVSEGLTHPSCGSKIIPLDH